MDYFIKHKSKTCIYFFLLLLLFTPLYPIKKVPLEHKIGQMVMVGLWGSDTSMENFKVLKEQIQKGLVGGILIGSDNIKNKEQLHQLVRFFKGIQAPYPLLISIDQEGGKVGRLKQKNGFTDYPSAKEIAKNKSLKEAFKIYLSMAETLKELGINLNLAPVLDLEINLQSPIIAKVERSYSGLPDIVTSYAREFIQAHSAAGIICAVKHFPGHGSALEDSHLQMTDVTETYQETEKTPYLKLIVSNLIDVVMVSHIVNKKVDSQYPASLSYRHVTEVLRKRLGFHGVVLTDDLQMMALTKYFDFNTIILKSIEAGNDILLFANWFNPDIEIPNKVQTIVKQAIKNRLIREKSINESFERIMQLKKMLPKD